MAKTHIHPLLDISLVDFSDTREIGGFASLLCRSASDAGMFLSGFTPTADTVEIRRQADRTIRRLDTVLPQMSEAGALSAVSVYDIIHRIAYTTPADRNTIDPYILSAFRSMLRGDKTIDPYDLFREITLASHLNPNAYTGKPLDWLTLRISEWHRQATLGFDPLKQTAYDIVNRATLLLETDLTAIEGKNQNNFKRRLFAATRHHLDSHDNAGSATLQALTRFLTAGRQYLPSDEAATLDNRLRTALLTHPSTNRFLRAALLPHHTDRTKQYLKTI